MREVTASPRQVAGWCWPVACRTWLVHRLIGFITALGGEKAEGSISAFSSSFSVALLECGFVSESTEWNIDRGLGTTTL